ncbi:unnamed protein product [Heterobilharzia americana]|nr:unnamed protein product [Heterobilharzia americana]
MEDKNDAHMNLETLSDDPTDLLKKDSLDCGTNVQNIQYHENSDILKSDTPTQENTNHIEHSGTIDSVEAMPNSTKSLSNDEDNIDKKVDIKRTNPPFYNDPKIIGKKVRVTKDPYSQKSIMSVNKKNGTDISEEHIHIDWLPYDYHKPFLGGYRNTITNYRYYNASTQTKPTPRKVKQVVKISRDTQTYKMRHFGNMTVNHMSTQFSKPGYFVSNSKDRVKTPGLYETADEYHARILKKVDF